MKHRLNYFLEFANLFFASIYIFLIGCTILNPAFTTGNSTASDSDSNSGGIVTITTTNASSSTSGGITSNTTGFDQSTTQGISESGSDVSTSTLSGGNTNTTADITVGNTTEAVLGCGDCRISPDEDCDICIPTFEIGKCTEECNIFYPIEILEKDLSLYCGDFNYCGDLGCGQCEADIACYVIHYKKILKSGKDPNKFIITATNWKNEEINPNIQITLTYEAIPNGILIPNNGAKVAGLYEGDIWLSEKSFYNQGSSVTDISCSITDI